MNRSEGIWTVEPEDDRDRREEIFLTRFKRALDTTCNKKVGEQSEA